MDLQKETWSRWGGTRQAASEMGIQSTQVPCTILHLGVLTLKNREHRLNHDLAVTQRKKTQTQPALHPILCCSKQTITTHITFTFFIIIICLLSTPHRQLLSLLCYLWSLAACFQTAPKCNTKLSHPVLTPGFGFFL